MPSAYENQILDSMSYPANTDYTNKDFNTIYTELLDYVKRLNTKWDPSVSNESDPGVVLIKLGALLADKLNFNIDKNILETFPLSVTQYGNARKLYDMLGYSMKWYMSGKLQVQFTYKGNPKDSEGNSIGDGWSFKLPKFTTSVTDADGENTYTLVEDLKFDNSGRVQRGTCIQGTVTPLTIGTNNIITLYNLDEYHRLYFPESMIAENGVFVYSVDSNGNEVEENGDWTRVDNLANLPPAAYVYSFGVLPDEDTCYIQFPSDIANLIGNGLRVYYTHTLGESGNVTAKTLVAPYSQISVDISGSNSDSGVIVSGVVINDDLQIVNSTGAFGGADPEGLDKAYDNYKRTIGTFNTLVTCQDYEDALFEATTEGTSESNNVVSNCVVSDRSNDLWRTYQVVQTDGTTTTLNDTRIAEDNVESEEYTKSPWFTEASIGITPAGEKKNEMDAFSLGIYYYQPIISSLDTTSLYNSTFCTEQKVASEDKLTIQIPEVSTPPDARVTQVQQNISAAIEANKSVQHDYMNMYQGYPYLLKNFISLSGTVFTYRKVTREEAAEVENNIKAALYKRYNSREINFGEAPSLDTLVSTVQNADSRIKYVSLAQPTYDLRLQRVGDITGSIENSDFVKELTDEQKVDILAKMVLSGHLQYYKFNTSFQPFFDESSSKFIGTNGTTLPRTNSEGVLVEGDTALTGIETSTTIYVEGNGKDSEIKENEALVLYAPNYYAATTYTAYVYYRLKGAWSTEAGVKIEKGTKYYLDRDNAIHITKTGDDPLEVDLKGKVISANFVMKSGSDVAGDAKGHVLNASESITVYEENTANIYESGGSNNYPYCAWSVKRDNNTLFTEEETEYILQNDEYFIYTDDPVAGNLVILSSGTQISRDKITVGLSIDEEGKTVDSEAVFAKFTNIDNAFNQGASALAGVWYNWEKNRPRETLSTTEMEIITLGPGTTITDATRTKVSEEKTEEEKISKFEKDPAVVESLTYYTDSSDKTTSIHGTLNASSTIPTSESLVDEGPIVKYEYTNTYSGSYKAYSRLDLNCGPSRPQTLEGDQVITLKYLNRGERTENSEELGKGKALQLSQNIAAAGPSISLTLKVDDYNTYPVGAYSYTPTAGSAGDDKNRNSAGYYKVDFTQQPKELTIPAHTAYACAVVASASTAATTITATSAVKEGALITLKVAQQGGSSSSSATLLNGEQSYYSCLLIFRNDSDEKATSNITFEAEPSEGAQLLLGEFSVLNLGKDGDGEYDSQLLASVQSLEKSENRDVSVVGEAINELSDSYDYSYVVPDKAKVNTSPLSTRDNSILAPEAFFDSNHICNKFTIAQINFNDSSDNKGGYNIKVDPSSIV